MSVPLFLSGAMLFGIVHATGAPATMTVYGEAGWLLTVQTDNFTHQRKCQLVNKNARRPDIAVAPGVLAFQFSPKLDTSNAWYRVGQAPARAWRDDFAQLVYAGALAQAEKLDNATNGAVAIPISDLEGAQWVAIRPAAKAAVRAFDITGVWKVIAAADGLGCRLGGQSEFSLKNAN